MDSNPYAQPIDNLSMFVHPNFKQHFRYMNDHEGVLLAQQLLREFTTSGYRSIIVIESGTSPIIQIIKKLRAYRTADISFTQIKIPRDQSFSLKQWFYANLTNSELAEQIVFNGTSMSRQQALATECSKNILSELVGQGDYTIYDSISGTHQYDTALTAGLRHITKGTKLANVFCRPFLLFDEYINSGTVLRNFNAIAQLFTSTPKFKVAAYCAFVDNARKYEKIAFTLYDKQTELECYQNGAYPYENRVDLIGYYYFITPNNFAKVSLADLYATMQSDTPKLDPTAFYDRLLHTIASTGALHTLKACFQENQVRQYTTQYDAARFIVKRLEQLACGETALCDLLDQVYEIYAPAWSPMPVKNHLDYWNGFKDAGDALDAVATALLADYKTYRGAILCDILQKLVYAKTKWDATIDHIIKEESL